MTPLPRNLAEKRRLVALPKRRRLGEGTVEAYVQSRRRAVRRVESVRLPALICTETRPVVQACVERRAAGRVRRPDVRKRNGARVSRAGRTRAETGAANRSTVTTRTAVAV